MTSHRHSADGSSVSVSVTADAQSPALIPATAIANIIQDAPDVI